MTNWTKLKKAIADVIKANGNQEITGAIMQQTLMSIVDNMGGNAQFGGVAVPSTVPADTDGSVFYLASTQGTYPNFSNINVGASEMAVFTKNTAGTWVKTSLPIQQKPLLIGGNVAAVTKGTGVVLSVPTLNADGTETASELSIEAATPANNGAMTKDQVNTLKEVDDFYTRMTDFVVGDNDDRTLINIETTEQNSISLKYKTLDVVSGSQAEKTKAIPAVSPKNGTAGAAGMNLVHDIPYFFDFYKSGFTSLSDGSDITNVLIPKFQTSYDVFDNLYTNVPAIQNKVFANPKAGDRILIGSLSGAPVGSAPLWATVTSAQRISGIYSVTVDYDGDTYIFAYSTSNDTATLKVPWSKVSSKRNIYSGDIYNLTPDLSEADIKGLLTPLAYQKYNIIYPIKPQTGDLMEEVTGDGESRFIPIIALRNEENPDEYTDIIIPYTGIDNRAYKIVLKNDLTSVQSYDGLAFKNYRRCYNEEALLALDTVKAETIENSITDTYMYSIEDMPSGLQLPEVGDLMETQDGIVPVCEVFFDRDNVQHTRWFSKGKLYEVTVNTELTRVPEDPKVIYDTTSGTLRDLYISAGAKYNEATGYYELNGLTDITEEQMRVIYKYAGTPQTKAAFAYSKARTNLPMPGMYNGSVYGAMFYACPNLEVVYLGNRQSSPISYDVPLVYTEGNNCFYLCKKLKKIYGKIHQRIDGWGLTFGECHALEEVRIAELRSSIQLSWSPNLSKESVQYMITNAKPLSGAAVGSIAITLHPTAYARLKDDADIVAALEAKGGVITLVSA